jgi:hypothetical protein
MDDFESLFDELNEDTIMDNMILKEEILPSSKGNNSCKVNLMVIIVYTYYSTNSSSYLSIRILAVIYSPLA